MKTLLYSSPPIHYLNCPPLKPRAPSLRPTAIRSRNPNLFSRKCRLFQANAKGFSGGLTSIDKPAKIKSSAGKEDRNSNGEEEHISEEVFNGIIVRILTFSGVPMAAGMVLLKVFDIVMEQGVNLPGVNLPLWIPYLTIFMFFGASTMELAYGPQSACLDPEKKGSILGFEEAQENWVQMWEEEESR